VFNILDDKEDYIQPLIGLELGSAFPIYENNGGLLLRKDWQCVTDDGRFLLIKYESGVLSVALCECENDLRHSLRVVATSEKIIISKLNFSEIKDFFEFQINEDDYMD
jgi:hypothetical protein